MTITLPTRPSRSDLPHAPTISPPEGLESYGGRCGYCVRLDWPDGSHSLVGYAVHPDRTDRRLRGLQRYWPRGPLSPLSYQIVEISRHDWRLHRRRGRCRAPDCPSAARHRIRT